MQEVEMAKKKSGAVAMDGPVGCADDVVVVAEKPKVIYGHKNVSVPVVEGLGGYARRRIDLRLKGTQAERLKQIANGLEDAGATLADGKYVVNVTDAIRWMIEQV